MPDTMELWASRVKNADPATHVGEVNRIFYYPDSGTLRISDGVTPGGLPINLIGNLANIAIANFVFNNTTITTSVPDADITIDSNGSGGNINILPGQQVNVGGALHVHASGNLSAAPSFDVASTGDVTILVPQSGYTSGVNIIGSSSGLESAPQNTGVLLHITGQDADPSRIYNDGNGAYAAYIGRRYNGTVASPTGILDNEIISRIGATPILSNTGWPAISTTRIDFVQHGNATPSNYGSQIEFWTTPLNSTTIARAGYFNGDTFYANNVTTSGNVVIKATGNASNVGILQVTNNSDGNIRYPVLANVVAQFTGKDNKTPYLIFDGYGNVASAATGGQFVFRTARGNLATPAAVQNNDPLGIIGGAGWADTGYGGIFASSIEFQAAGTFTDSSRPGKIVFKVIPDASTTAATALTVKPTTAVWNDGMVMSNAWVNLPAGTTTQPPLQFTAGSFPTVPVTGGVAYDGTIFAGVPQGLERGIIPSQQQFVLNATRNLTAGTTSAQSLFGKTVDLAANTRYYYEINAYFAKNGSGSNQPTINYGLAVTGGGSLFSHFYTVNSSVTSTVASVASGSQMFNYITTGFSTGVPITGAMPISVSYARVLIKGYIDVNVAGTVNFQIAFSDAPNTSCSVQPRSGVYIYPVGPAGTDTSVGTWA